MQEIAPEAYVAPEACVAPRTKTVVREWIWKVMMQWAELIPEYGGAIPSWNSRTAPSGLGIRLVGWSEKEFVDHEGIWLNVHNLTGAHGTDEIVECTEAEKPAPDAGDPTLYYVHPK